MEQTRMLVKMTGSRLTQHRKKHFNSILIIYY